MNIEELRKAAEAAQVYCNKCGYLGQDEPSHLKPMTGIQCGYMASKTVAVPAETLLKLLAVVDAAKAVASWLIVDGDSQPLLDTLKELEK